MKVGFVLPKLSGGGAEYVAHEWAAYLSDANVDVRIFVTDGSETATPAGMRIVPLAGSSFLSRVASLRSQVLSENVDVLVGFMPYWNLLTLLAGKSWLRRRVRTVLSGHTIESPYGVNRGRGFLMQTTLARIIYRFADAYIASSHAVAAEAVARCSIDRSKLWVVQNPVFPGAVQQRLRPGFTSSTTASVDVLVVPGRLVEQKRPALALDVAYELGLAGNPPPEVWFVGDGPSAEGLKLRAKELRVKAVFIPWDPKWAEQMPPASVVLLPSMLEGFGNVLLDATAGGLPIVVSSKALGVADAIIPDVTGVLVSGDSASHYASGVLRAQILEDMDTATVSRWLNRFTRSCSGRQLLSILSALPN